MTTRVAVDARPSRRTRKGRQTRKRLEARPRFRAGSSPRSPPRPRRARRRVRWRRRARRLLGASRKPLSARRRTRRPATARSWRISAPRRARRRRRRRRRGSDANPNAPPRGTGEKRLKNYGPPSWRSRARPSSGETRERQQMSPWGGRSPGPLGSPGTRETRRRRSVATTDAITTSPSERSRSLFRIIRSRVVETPSTRTRRTLNRRRQIPSSVPVTDRRSVPEPPKPKPKPKPKKNRARPRPPPRRRVCTRRTCVARRASTGTGAPSATRARRTRRRSATPSPRRSRRRRSRRRASPLPRVSRRLKIPRTTRTRRSRRARAPRCCFSGGRVRKCTPGSTARVRRARVSAWPSSAWNGAGSVRASRASPRSSR